MTKALASLATLGLVLSVALIGVPPCLCSASAAAAAPSGCHDASSGLVASPMACGCPCLSSAPADPAAPRVDPVVPGAAGPHLASPLAMSGAGPAVASAWPASRTLASSPPRHQILRV